MHARWTWAREGGGRGTIDVLNPHKFWLLGKSKRKGVGLLPLDDIFVALQLTMARAVLQLIDCLVKQEQQQQQQ